MCASVWQSFAMKRHITISNEVLMKEADEAKAKARFERRWLFHGTPPELVDKISQQVSPLSYTQVACILTPCTCKYTYPLHPRVFCRASTARSRGSPAASPSTARASTLLG